MQRAEFKLEVKSLTEEGEFEGYASVFGTVDSYGDRVEPGAFVEGLAKARREGRSIKMLWNHDPDQPIGVWPDLAEDAKGLWGRGRLILDVPKAREAHALMKAGAIEALSIGYVEREAAPDGNVRSLKKVDLYEISPVPFPANGRAKILEVKAAAVAIVDKLAAGDRLTEREFEHLVKGLGLSNRQAERAARVHLKGQGEPAVADQSGDAFLRALRAQLGQ